MNYSDQKRSSKKKIIIIILSVVLFAFLAVLAYIPIMIIDPVIKKHADVQFVSPESFGVRPEQVTLKTEDGLSIEAWLTKAENAKGTVILLSGVEKPSVTAFWGYAKMLNENGFSVLLIEMRGHGKSEGSISLGFKEWLDVKAGVAYLKGIPSYDTKPVIVWGTSMGGATAINSIGEIDEIDGVISFSAYSSFADVFADNMEMMGFPAFLTAIQKPFTNLYFGFNFGFDKVKISPKNEIKNLNNRPALLMHSTEDSQVPLKNLERLKKASGDSVETFVREGDEHFIYTEAYIENPSEDTEISTVVLQFLNDNFG